MQEQRGVERSAREQTAGSSEGKGAGTTGSGTVAGTSADAGLVKPDDVRRLPQGRSAGENAEGAGEGGEARCERTLDARQLLSRERLRTVWSGPLLTGEGAQTERSGTDCLLALTGGDFFSL